MTRTEKTVIWMLVALIVAVGLASPVTAQVKTLNIGDKAPDFSLPGSDGRVHKLSDFSKARILVVVFTCNHCPTAQAYQERIKKIAADYGPKGVTLVAISPNDPKAIHLDELGYTEFSDTLEEMKIRAKEAGFQFPYLYDGNTQAVSALYGPVSTPHIFIFDSERRLRYTGRIDDSDKPAKVTSNDARNAIDALLSGTPVPVEKTKTFGCSIKWSSKRDAVQQLLDTWTQEPVALNSIDAESVRKLAKNDSPKLRMINIWATWCGPCMAEFNELVSMNRMYRGRDFELITISADSPERKDAVLGFLKEKQASFKNFLFSSDDKYKLMDSVDEQSQGGIPYTILIKPGGEIIYREMGTISPLKIKKAIVQYLGRFLP